MTYDRPLYKKARDILLQSDLLGELRNVIVRLGGFHMVMSYMGAIGYVMEGSGLLELFSVHYAPQSAKTNVDWACL